MSGVSTGPRQFQLMSGFTTLKDGAVTGSPKSSQWHYESGPGGGGSCWTQEKLDLRAFNNSDRANGLDLLQIALQEASPFFFDTDDEEEAGGLFLLDVLTTVDLDRDTIREWVQTNMRHWLTPGFLYEQTGVAGSRMWELSPSMVTWGLWRCLAIDRNMIGLNAEPVLKTYATGNFGSGEVMVSPQVYWTRIVVATSENDTVYIPSANLHMAVNATDLTDGQEIIQMVRSSGR